MMGRKLYPPVFFLVVTILAFWKVIFHGEFTLLIGGDVASAYYPWFDVASYWFKKGILILWDPYVYSGKPFMGEPQPGLFYPLNWIFMLLPARGGGINLDGMQALLILNYFLMACFTFLLARSIGLSPYGAAAAGVSFALGGYTVHIFGYVNKLSGFVWMPLVILCFRRALLSEHWKARVRWGVMGRDLTGADVSSRTSYPGHPHRALPFLLRWLHPPARVEIPLEGESRNSSDAGRRSYHRSADYYITVVAGVGMGPRRLSMDWKRSAGGLGAKGAVLRAPARGQHRSPGHRFPADTLFRRQDKHLRRLFCALSGAGWALVCAPEGSVVLSERSGSLPLLELGLFLRVARLGQYFHSRRLVCPGGVSLPDSISIEPCPAGGLGARLPGRPILRRSH